MHHQQLLKQELSASQVLRIMESSLHILLSGILMEIMADARLAF
jgi:hypothetical protein